MPPKKIAAASVKLPAPGGKKGQAHCVLCAVVAERVCQRCGDFYCSKECQIMDWQRHRYICFPMPALVMPEAFSILQSQEELSMDIASVSKAGSIKASAAPMPNDASINDKVSSTSSCSSTPTISGVAAKKAAADTKNIPTPSTDSIKTKNKTTSLPTVVIPATNSVVIISGFRSANRCLVRSVSADQAYSQVCEKVNALGNEMPRVKNPRIHGFVLALHNGAFQRAKVLQTRPDKSAKLLFVDQGITKIRNFDSMREISDEILALPSFCFLVQLKDVHNYSITNDILDFLSQFDGEKCIMQYDSVSNYNKILVELVNVKTQKSLNETVREYCSTKKVYNSKNVYSNGEQMESSVSAAVKPLEEGPNVAAKDDAPPPTVAPSQEPLKQTETRSMPIKETLPTTNTVSPAKELPKDEPTSVKELPLELKAAELTATTAATEIDVLPEEKIELKTVDKTISPKLNGIPLAPKVNGAEGSNNGPILVPPFEMKLLSVSDKAGIDLYIVDNSKLSRGMFGAFDRVLASEFGRLNTAISKISPSKPYTPVLKEYVLAKFENSFYRAKVEQIKQTPQTQQTVYRMTYLDYTNIEEVTGEDICRYPVDLDFPCITSICMIEDFPHKPNAEQIAYLSEALKVHEIIHVDAVFYMKNVAWIKCNELIKKLETM
ncbi:uncharacterized protein Veneno [Drosophila pseudoobscura]|uniref:Uncharacterized protein Veneno n=1 Tax=Drosophila pseudoobscura pseudoobscura TaxID=46245 RepID=A0A6I8UPB1_DROPS|nr:uncharacterized protein LOC4801699 [Drosophila pseudoobscura]